MPKTLIACYCEPQKKKLRWQVHTLFASFLANRTPDLDILVSVPPGTEALLHPGIPVRPLSPIGDSYAHPALAQHGFSGYPFMNQCLAAADTGSRYDLILRTDCDTVITPTFGDFRVDRFTVGRGAYLVDYTRERLREFALEAGLTRPARWSNIGSTWYGDARLVEDLSFQQIELTRRIIFEADWTVNEWPSWYAPVASMYSGELLLNETLDALDVLPDLLDGPVGPESTKAIHLHMWPNSKHGDHFSKHAFEAGFYRPDHTFKGNAALMFRYVRLGMQMVAGDLWPIPR